MQNRSAQRRLRCQRSSPSISVRLSQHVSILPRFSGQPAVARGRRKTRRITNSSRQGDLIAKQSAVYGPAYMSCSLTKIYTDLCECCAKPKDDCEHRFCEDDCNFIGGTCSNRFQALEFGDHDNEYSTVDDDSACQLDFTELGDVCIDGSRDESPSTLVDDELSHTFEICQQVHVHYPPLPAQTYQLTSYRKSTKSSPR